MANVHIDYNAIGHNWQDDIVGNKIGGDQGEWLDNTHFAVKNYQNGNNDNIRIYKFMQDGKVWHGDIKQMRTVSSWINSGKPWPPSVAQIDQALTAHAGATWFGKLPDVTALLSKIQSLQKVVDSQLQELYKAPGTLSESLESNYYATMMSGILVAMLGTTVLFYTFKNI